MNVNPDDISSIVAFAGNQIGVMWSNQNVSAMYFAAHFDGQPDTTWEASRTALQGPASADDHINLKSLQSDGSGRVFAAVKTSMTTSSAPLIMLLVRDLASGNWTSSVFGRVADDHTRPIVLLDEEHSVIHMFATAPEAGGTIYEKTSPTSAISFPLGLGTPVIRDAASAAMNNVTSTKQNVNSTTGLVILATNDTTHRYWHAYQSLGGSVPPPELCDGIDNNGNGLVDEGFDVGVSCTSGLGACQASGIKVCSADHTTTVCNAIPGTPTTEICDGIDNDCDGTADNPSCAEFDVDGNGRIDGVEVDDRLLRGLQRVLFPAIAFEEVAPFDAAAATVTADLTALVVFGDHSHVEAAERLHVGGDAPLAVHDHDDLALGRE